LSEDFLPPIANEVYVDAGCCDGKTIMDFLEFAGSGKIYGFEPESDCFRRTMEALRANLHSSGGITIFPQGLWHKAETLHLTKPGEDAGAAAISEQGEEIIETVSLDEAIEPGDRVTFIKMDIEGAELNALRGARETISRNLPRLAISIYHKPEDIVTIPSYIMSLSDRYVFYIRHHAPWLNVDTVLYAIAK
jgi:FkbM family methyltransferase